MLTRQWQVFTACPDAEFRVKEFQDGHFECNCPGIDASPTTNCKHITLVRKCKDGRT